MVQINFARKEINCKIVYYGPGMSGKTTNLEVVHQKTPGENKGELTCIATEGDRTLFFDFMPLNLGNIMGMNIKFQLYTVPGQVYYNSTRKLVLRGVDGVIFVADSAPDKMAENIESLDNLRENLEEYGKDIKDLPIVIQYNKQDLPNALGFDEMEEKLNTINAPAFPGVASKGDGVFSTLKALSAVIIENINQRDEMSSGRAQSPAVTTPSPTADTTGATSASHSGAATTSTPVATPNTPTTPATGGGSQVTPIAAELPGHGDTTSHPGHESSGATVTATQASTATLSPQATPAPATTPDPMAETQVLPQSQLSSNLSATPAQTASTQSNTRSVPKKQTPRKSTASPTPRRATPKTKPRAAQAPTSQKEGTNWAVVLLFVFVVAFAATALVAFLR